MVFSIPTENMEGTSESPVFVPENIPNICIEHLHFNRNGDKMENVPGFSSLIVLLLGLKLNEVIWNKFGVKYSKFGVILIQS